MLKAFERDCLLFYLVSFWCGTDSAYNSNPVTCPSIYIDFLCIPFRFDGRSWSRAMETCQEYSIPEFSGANMAAIPSAGRQREMEKFLDRIIMSPLWVGGVENRFIWKWSKENLDLQVQGCFSNLSSNFFQVFSDDNSEMTVGKCLDICKRSFNGYAAINRMNSCFCGNVINKADKSEARKCDFPCSSANQITWWCGGHNISYFTLFRIGGVGAKWGFGQPDNESGEEFCAVLDLNLDGGLADENCNSTYPYMCRFSGSNSSCQATGYRLISQICYYLSSQSNPLTWKEADQSCRKVGAELATLNSDLQQMTLRNWIAQRFRNPNAKVWVGAYVGGWRWLAANTFTYTNWAPNEPKTSSPSASSPMSSPTPLSSFDDDDDDDDLHCIMMNKDVNKGYTWTARKCATSPIFFLCQRGEYDDDDDDSYDYYKSYSSDTWSGTFPEDPMDPAWFETITSTLTTTSTTFTTMTTTISSEKTSTRYVSDNSSQTADHYDLTKSSAKTTTNAIFANNSNFNNTNNNINNNDNNKLNNNNSLLPPENIVEDESFNKTQIAIIAFIIVLFLLFLLLMLMCIVICCYCRTRKKVSTIKELDARPVAHLPESTIGHVMSTSSTEKLREHDQLDH